MLRPRPWRFEAKYKVRPSWLKAGDESHALGSFMLRGTGSDHSPLRNLDIYKSTSLAPRRFPELPLANTMVRPSGVNVIQPLLTFSVLMTSGRGASVARSTIAPLEVILKIFVKGVPVASYTLPLPRDEVKYNSSLR